jgi:hypothetical protein
MTYKKTFLAIFSVIMLAGMNVPVLSQQPPQPPVTPQGWTDPIKEEVWGDWPKGLVALAEYTFTIRKNQTPTTDNFDYYLMELQVNVKPKDPHKIWPLDELNEIYPLIHGSEGSQQHLISPFNEGTTVTVTSGWNFEVSGGGEVTTEKKGGSGQAKFGYNRSYTWTEKSITITNVESGITPCQSKWKIKLTEDSRYGTFTNPHFYMVCKVKTGKPFFAYAWVGIRWDISGDPFNDLFEWIGPGGYRVEQAGGIQKARSEISYLRNSKLEQISLGASRLDGILTRDLNYYSFITDSVGEISIELTDQLSEMDLRIALLNIPYRVNPIISDDQTGNQIVRRISITNAPPGTWFISIYAVKGGLYQLNTSFKPGGMAIVADGDVINIGLPTGTMVSNRVTRAGSTFQLNAQVLVNERLPDLTMQAFYFTGEAVNQFSSTALTFDRITPRGKYFAYLFRGTITLDRENTVFYVLTASARSSRAFVETSFKSINFSKVLQPSTDKSVMGTISQETLFLQPTAHYFLDIDSPQAVKLSLLGYDQGNDYDLLVFNTDGAIIASSINNDPKEEIVLLLPIGRYVIQIVSFFGAGKFTLNIGSPF